MFQKTSFKFSAETKAHLSDIKAIDTCVNLKGEIIMVSASRDGTVKVWKVCGKNGLSLLSEHSEHNGFVNAVSISSFNLSLNMDQSHEIIVASGGNDKIVNLFDPIQNIIFGALVGHEGNISQISRFDDGTIMTTSWDNTSRIWINNQCLHILKGHNQAVWGGCFVSKDHFLTVSADKTIILWKNSSVIRVYNGHSDVVRSIIMTDGDFKSLGDFLSVGNDGLLIFWSLDSTDPKNIVNAHESFIYTVTSSKKFIATAGEDRIVKLWTLDSNGNSISCTQSIPIPASSIWSVKFDSEGINLFCASSDGYIYQFSNNLELQCGSDDQAYKEFNSRLNSMQLSSGQMNSQVSELDVLKNPGKKIGQVVTVNSEGGNISAYQWDGTIWCKIGDVVDDLTGSKKTLYNGKVYDYVFDVEFESSKTPLKLPCDRNENPYEVASKFISNNNLSPDLIHEIVDFLIKNIETKTIQVVDSNLFNPYLNSEASSNNKVEGSNIPLLKSVNYEGLIKKISEFNKIECGFNIDMKFLSSLKNSLEKNIPFADTQTMLQAIKKWDANRIFPLIDALRVIIVHKDTNIMECIKTIGDRFSEFSEIPSAVLTFSRLLINAIVDLEAFNYMMKTPNFFETVLDRCYSIPISDLDIPVLLVKSASIQVSNLKDKSLAETLSKQVIMRFRTLTISDHQKHYLESIKYIWKLLDDSTKASIRTELNACILEGKSYNIDCVAMMQEICQVNKSLVL